MLRKKLLSLGLAAAMVATTGVSAFAQNQTIIGNDTQPLDANVKVTGVVTKDDGTAPNGKLSVEVPTAAVFSVDQNGNFNGTTMKIKNNSSVAINVTVGSFSETNQSGGIKVVDETVDLSKESRDTVLLQVVGNSSDVTLAGVDKFEVISEIGANDSDDIQLIGSAGSDTTKNVANGVSEDFNLVFKIAKKK